MQTWPNYTLLAINGLTVPEASARFVRQSLSEIPQAGSFRRTVNMQLRNVAPPAASGKYKTVVTCTDINAPIWDQLHVGLQVVIDCIPELFYATTGGSPTKSVVPDSTRVFGGVTWYRPRLTMMVTAWGDDMEENEAARSWTLEAEEV
jgi:hypothetical protein